MDIFVILTSLFTFSIIAASVVFLLYVVRVNKRRSSQQDLILQKYADEAKATHRFRIRYASEARYKFFWKIFPWENSGIVFLQDSHIRLCLMGNGEAMREILLDVNDSNITWIGDNFWPNGALNWFSISTLESGVRECHYLTSETGMTIMNTKKSTYDIYTQIKWQYPSLPYDKHTEEKSEYKGIALEKNKYSLAVIVLIFTLLIFTIIENLANSETFITRPDFALLFVSGAFIAVITSVILKYSKLPIMENVILSVLLGAITSFSLPSLMLVSNQLTDADGLQAYEYFMQEDKSFLATDVTREKLPKLHFPRDKEYWSQFDVHSIHEFEIRKGGLGFYQINMEPVNQKMKEYYWSERKQKRNEKPE